MSQEDTVRTQLRTFLAKHLRNLEVDDDEDLFGSGLVNSLFAMQLVLFVESAFGLTVDNEDLDLRNFRSIDAIVGLVSRKQGLAA